MPLQSSDITITTQGGSSVTGFDFNNTNVTNSGGNFSGIEVVVLYLETP